VAVSRPISTRHDNLLTNDRVTFGVMLTYSCTLANFKADFFFVTPYRTSSEITNVVFDTKKLMMEYFRQYFRNEKIRIH